MTYFWSPVSKPPFVICHKSSSWFFYRYRNGFYFRFFALFILKMFIFVIDTTTQYCLDKNSKFTVHESDAFNFFSTNAEMMCDVRKTTTVSYLLETKNSLIMWNRYCCNAIFCITECIVSRELNGQAENADKPARESTSHLFVRNQLTVRCQVDIKLATLTFKAWQRHIDQCQLPPFTVIQHDNVSWRVVSVRVVTEIRLSDMSLVCVSGWGTDIFCHAAYT